MSSDPNNHSNYFPNMASQVGHNWPTADTTFTMSHNDIRETMEKLCSFAVAIHKLKVSDKPPDK